MKSNVVCHCPHITYLDPQDGGRGHSDSILMFDHTPYSAVNDSIVLFNNKQKTNKDVTVCYIMQHGVTSSEI